MRNAINSAFVAEKKQYFSAKVEILRVETNPMMIPLSPPDDPHMLPKGHFVPGPGASYQPPAKIV